MLWQLKLRLKTRGIKPLLSFLGKEIPEEIDNRYLLQILKFTGIKPFAITNRTAFIPNMMLAQIHQQFIRVVKEGRGERLKETPETFSGLYWNGEQAISLGLADKLGNLDYVAREVVKAQEIIDYTPKENVAERLAKRFGAAIGAGAVKALRSLAPMR